jgi:hypothetical protein
MKCLSILVFLGAGAFAQLANVRSVYILPMAGGLDQYLASGLTREHILRVVTDPKEADALITDRLGEAFEQRMAEIHPPVKAEKDDAKTAGEGQTHNAFRTTAARGTIFLVDAKTGAVLWSDHEKPPHDTTDQSMNRQAERIVKKLREKPAS